VEVLRGKLAIGCRVRGLSGIWGEGTIVGRIDQTITRRVEGRTPDGRGPVHSESTYWVVKTDGGGVVVVGEIELRLL
jgi:hypothetical protein